MTIRKREGGARRASVACILGALLLCLGPSLRAQVDKDGKRKSYTGQHQHTLRIAGSTTIYNLVIGLGQRYAEFNPSLRFVHTKSSSGEGFSQLLDGECDIARMSRALRPGELDKAIRSGSSVRTFRLGYDAIVVIAHPSRKNILKSMTLEQMKQIWVTGEINNWSQLGFDEDTPLIVQGGSARGGTRKAFLEYVAPDEEMGPHVMAVRNTTYIVEKVAENRDAIGIISYNHVTPEVRIVPVLTKSGKLLKPRNSIGALETYPLMRPLQLVTRSPLSPEVARFIDLALRARGQLYINEHGFIPVRNW